MSRRHKDYVGYGYPNIYIIIILILIVLQWFRVGCLGTAGAAAPGALPESVLISNGGLFIITLFILIACSCLRPMHERHHRHHRCGC